MDPLIQLLILVVVVGIVLYIAQLILGKIPMDETFKQIAWLIMILIAILIIVRAALPLIHL